MSRVLVISEEYSLIHVEIENILGHLAKKCVVCCSCIHDHSGSHCFMKMLQGSLKETRYEWPDKEQENEMASTGHIDLAKNEVTYMSGKYDSQLRYYYRTSKTSPFPSSCTCTSFFNQCCVRRLVVRYCTQNGV